MKRKLVIDLGNTLQKISVFYGSEIERLESFTTLSISGLEDFIVRSPGVSSCILSSVIGEVNGIADFLKRTLPVIVLNETTALPLENCYETPATLGRDRLAAAVAGHHFFPDRNVLIVTMGTCITYDFVNSQNQYLGGSISPGLEMRLKALHTFTGKLPLIHRKTEVDLIGRTTEGSILSGVIYGILAEIHGITRKYDSKYPGLQVVLSGGDSPDFENQLKISTFALPNIVLHGLNIILDFNEGIHQN